MAKAKLHLSFLAVFPIVELITHTNGFELPERIEEPQTSDLYRQSSQSEHVLTSPNSNNRRSRSNRSLYRESVSAAGFTFNQIALPQEISSPFGFGKGSKITEGTGHFARTTTPNISAQPT